MAEPKKYNTNLTETQLNEIFDNVLNKFPARFTENENKITKNETAIGAVEEQSILNRQTLGYERKNLLKNTATTTTTNGITFAVNDDGSISASGTATADAEIAVRIMTLEPNVTYQLSGCPQGGSTTTYHIYSLWIDNYASGGWDVGSGKTIKNTTDSARKIQFRCRIMSGQTVDGLTFYPMLRDARISDATYVPYKASVEEQLAKLEALIATLTTTTEET